MTNQHTPGPWAVGPAPHADCRIYATSETHAIARTYGPELNDIGVCALTGPQNKADARLIAAAPELLEALVELRDWYSEHTGMPAVAANAAIAKAKGDTGP